MKREESHCTVCGKSTRRFLFGDNNLNIPVCSYGCENRYLDTLTAKHGAQLLSRLDYRITKAKRRLTLCWATAGLGVLVILLGFVTKATVLFLVGAVLATLCAFLTRYFEGRVTRLTQMRERIST